MKARRKSSEVMAFQFYNVDLNQFMVFLGKGKEHVRYDTASNTISIKKDFGDITLSYGNWALYYPNENVFWFIDHNIFLETYEFTGKPNVYRKKVYVVDYVEFTDTHDLTIINILKFLGVNDDPRKYIDVIKRDKYILVNTLEGQARLCISNILINGVMGEFYVLKKDDFLRNYDRI